MKKVIDQLFEKNYRPISLIWHSEKAFEFMCWHYIDFAASMGFESYQATKLLKQTKANQLPNQEALDKVRAIHYFDKARLEDELCNMKKLKQSTDLPVGGGCFGPLTVASTILGVEETLRLSAKDPGFLEATLAYITEHMITLAKEEAKIGMEFFWIAEPLASLFPPKHFYQFCGKYLKAIFDCVDEPGYLHVCGKTIKHTQAMVDTGAQVLSIDYSTDIFDCIRMVPEDVVIMGNINPMLLKYGDQNEIAAETLKINEACKNYKNFIFSTGCSIPEETPVENIAVATRITRDYSIHSNEDYRAIRELTQALLSKKGDSEALVKKTAPHIAEIASEEAALIRTIDRRYKNGRY
ncbi:MAG: hypothetical protein JXO44_01090 [Clostridia bacterium]|nr:hypothetical protein [Clostridia bacterium]